MKSGNKRSKNLRAAKQSVSRVLAMFDDGERNMVKDNKRLMENMMEIAYQRIHAKEVSDNKNKKELTL